MAIGDQTQGCFRLKLGKSKQWKGSQDFITSESWCLVECSSQSQTQTQSRLSMLKKIHIEQRSNLDHDTIVSLKPLKYNTDGCCQDVELSEELLTASKKFTNKYVTPTLTQLTDGNLLASSASASSSSTSGVAASS